MMLVGILTLPHQGHLFLSITHDFVIESPTNCYINIFKYFFLESNRRQTTERNKSDTQITQDQTRGTQKSDMYPYIDRPSTSNGPHLNFKESHSYSSFIYIGCLMQFLIQKCLNG